MSKMAPPADAALSSAGNRPPQEERRDRKSEIRNPKSEISSTVVEGGSLSDLVLVVEDDPANAVLVEAILTTVGNFEVVWSDDGDEILRVVKERPVAAVLMDVSLSHTRVGDEKVDGVELTRRIRDLPQGLNLPVVLLTAHAMRGDRERLLFSSSANDYVAKPIIDQKGLVSLVERHIRAAKAVKEELEARRREGDGSV
jgi:two-component system cell cycle response regulator DivK